MDRHAEVTNGYQFTVASSCGAVFERWGTTREIHEDLLRLKIGDLVSLQVSKIAQSLGGPHSDCAAS